MSWNTRYLPPDQSLWQGRHDTPPASAFFQIIKPLNLLDQTTLTNKQPAFVLIGFACDEGVRRNLGRVGAAEGPAAIRQVLGRLPVQSQDIVIYDAGNIDCSDGDLEAAQKAFAEVISMLLSAHMTPIGLGGGHEIAFANFQGIVNEIPAQHIGIANFDAHFDMRPSLPDGLGSSGTGFRQIAELCRANKRRLDYNCIGIQHAGNSRQLFETAKQYNTHIAWADELHQGLSEKSVDFLDRIIDENEVIYVSLCLDVFSAACAPGVSAPQPLGLWPWHIIPLVRQLAASGKVISYDIAELSPRYDFDQCTAKLAANLIYEIVHHHSDHPRNW